MLQSVFFQQLNKIKTKSYLFFRFLYKSKWRPAVRRPASAHPGIACLGCGDCRFHDGSRNSLSFICYHSAGILHCSCCWLPTK